MVITITMLVNMKTTTLIVITIYDNDFNNRPLTKQE